MRGRAVGMVSGIGCLLISAVLAINIFIGQYATKYLVRTWGHKEIATAPAVAIGLIGGEVVIPAALVTYVLVKSGVVNP